MDQTGYQLYLRALITLIFLLGAMIAVLWVLKRLNLISANTRPRGRDRRLGIVETLMLDGKRRLILIRRDGIEHLIIVGPTSETIIETNIAITEDASHDAPARIMPVLE